MGLFQACRKPPTPSSRGESSLCGETLSAGLGAVALEPQCLGSNPSSAIYQLCDTGQVLNPLCPRFLFCKMRVTTASKSSELQCGKAFEEKAFTCSNVRRPQLRTRQSAAHSTSPKPQRSGLLSIRMQFTEPIGLWRLPGAEALCLEWVSLGFPWRGGAGRRYPVQPS